MRGVREGELEIDTPLNTLIARRREGRA